MSEILDNNHDRQAEPYLDGEGVDSVYGDHAAVTADDPEAGEPTELDDDLPDELPVSGEPTGEADEPQPGITDRTGDEPPDEPPPALPETATPGERGIALQRVLDYAAVANEQVYDSIVDRVTASEYGADLVDHLTAQGATLNEAVDEISRVEVDGVTLADMVEDEELVFAKTQYGDALEACGLDLHIEDGVTIEMAEPGAFVAALRETPEPADPTEPSQLLQQAPDLVHYTLISTSATLMGHNTVEATAANGGIAPPSVVAPHEPTHNEMVVASTLGQHAGQMAIELDRLGAPEHTVDSLRQFAMARADGLLIPWAVGHDIKLLGHNPLPLGLDRYTTEAEWQQAYRYLEALQARAPDSLFCREVRGTVMADLEAALNGPDPVRPPEHVPEEIRARWIAGRAARRAETEPLLRDALYRIPRIFRGQR